MTRRLDIGRCSGDDGAVLTEAALVLPVLAILLVGAFDFGMGWRQNAYQGTAIGNGLRQLATNGRGRQADLFALQSFMATMSGATNMVPNKVVIFKASSTGAPTNASCLTMTTSNSGAGISGACNVYNTTQLQALTTGNFGTATETTCVSNRWDRFWCPLDRKVLQGDPPDMIGFYAESTYQSFTKVWGASFVLRDDAVIQIEPKVT